MAFSYDLLKNPQYFQENCIPVHSDHKWYANEDDLADKNNSLIYSLNGYWHFNYALNEKSVPIGFEKLSYDCHPWESIAVPAHIQMEGYDRPQYANQQYPWDGLQDVSHNDIPNDFNPVACYVRYFYLPDNFQNKRVFISAQGSESCIAVWLNGQYVGFSSDSFSPSEFELTEFLRSGENKLAIRVYKWHSGSWLEDQDFFRFSGIYRNIYLYAVPNVHIMDLKLVPTLSDDFTNGTLTIAGTMLCKSKWQLGISFDNRIVLKRDDNDKFSLQININHPELWSAENPVLYPVEIKLFDEKGQMQEIICESIGFRRFELKNGLMLLNGKRIVFKGVNRHDFDAKVGRAVTPEMIERDILTMKRNNINALRTCHYLDNSYVYELCDKLGLYVIAENNMETHGTWVNPDEPLENILPGDNMKWQPMLLDRINSTYQVAKNHTSILIWSVGNESFGGRVIRNMANKFRELDNTRLVHYEGVFHDRRYSDRSSDMESQMYPPVSDIKKFLAEHLDKPFICCEYSHSMGNSNGGMSWYTDLTDIEPRYQGGFIWDYIDQAIYGKDRFGQPTYFYGGDLDDRPCDYAFSGNGIAYADGTETPKMAEVKYNYQNISVSFDFDNNTFSVKNKNLFTNTNKYKCYVTLARNGKEINKTSVNVDIAPLQEKAISLPFEKAVRSGEYAVTVSFVLRNDEAWAKAGHEIAFGQGVYSVQTLQKTIDYGKYKPLKIIDTEFNIGVIGDNFRVLFTKLEGGLASYVYGGVEMLKSIPMPNFWRASVDNDIGGMVNLHCAQWKVGSQLVSHRKYNNGYWNEMYHPTLTVNNNIPTITYHYNIPTNPVSGCTLAYTVKPDGTVNCKLNYKAVDGLPAMPEFGVIFKLSADYDNLEWYGYGQAESYVDRKNGTRLGIWKSTVKEQMSHYLHPQESGSHIGTRWAKVTNYKKRGIIFSGDNITFSALPYTPHEIDNAQHQFELPPVHYTVVRCALQQMGIGGDDTWGSVPHEEYWLPQNQDMQFEFDFKGYI